LKECWKVLEESFNFSYVHVAVSLGLEDSWWQMMVQAGGSKQDLQDSVEPRCWL